MSKRKPNDKIAAPAHKASAKVVPLAPPAPKRGAFRTPRAEIERAEPYVPDAEEGRIQTQTEPMPIANAEVDDDRVRKNLTFNQPK